MQKSQLKKQLAAVPIVVTKSMKKQYYKPLVITLSVAILNLVFGFDPKFTIINLIWLLPFKTDK